MAKSSFWGKIRGEKAEDRDSRWNQAAEGLKHDVKKELNYAMHDVRQKAVEEGWFGRQVTPDHSTHGFYQSVDKGPAEVLPKNAQEPEPPVASDTSPSTPSQPGSYGMNAPSYEVSVSYEINTKGDAKAEPEAPSETENSKASIEPSMEKFYHTDDLRADDQSANVEQAQSAELKPSKFDEIYGQDYQPIEPEGPEQEGMDIDRP